MDAQIVAEIIAGIASIVGGVSLYWGRRHKNARHALQKEHDELVRNTLKLNVDLMEWSSIEKDLKKLMENSSVDRFIMLRCYNGDTDPSKTTAIYQYRLGLQERFEYIAVRLDEDYVRRLKDMWSNKYHRMTCGEAESSIIKSIYEAEGVIHSIWFPVYTVKLPGHATAIHTYCSFSTHTTDPIDSFTEQKCRTLVWKIADLLRDS